jgi:hypothetical protein
VALFIVGLVLGRMPYRTAGGYWMSADQVDSECRTVGQLTGQVLTSPSCQHAHEAMAGCGSLIVLGLGLAVAGVTLAIRSLHNRAAMTANRHTARRSSAKLILRVRPRFSGSP